VAWMPKRRSALWTRARLDQRTSSTGVPLRLR
jgi:hypothetical protein